MHVGYRDLDVFDCQDGPLFSLQVWPQLLTMACFSRGVKE